MFKYNKIISFQFCFKVILIVISIMSAQKFLDDNLDKLIQIYIMERKSSGFGSLFINFNNETNNMDCRFFPLNEISFSEDIYNTFVKFQEENRESIMYITFVELNDKNDETYHILQYDLDTKSYKK